MHISSCSLLSLRPILVWNGMRLGPLICVKFSKIVLEHMQKRGATVNPSNLLPNQTCSITSSSLLGFS